MVLNWTDTLRRIGSCNKSYREVGAGKEKRVRKIHVILKEQMSG